jgi:hypothetical protein
MPPLASSSMLATSRLTALSLPAKICIIIIGYVVALLVASAAVGVRMAFTSGPDAQASSGMYAFGDAVVFVGIFGLCALVPTSAGLLFLRSCDLFWRVLSVSAVGLALTGIAATILFTVGRHATASPLATWAAFSVLRILVAPLLVLALLVCAFFAPHRLVRIVFVTAAIEEAAVSAYAGIVWFLPLLIER